MSHPTLYTVKQFSAKHLAFPIGGIRWLIFNADNNRLDEFGAIVRIGRKVLIDEDQFMAWVQESNKKKAC